MNKIIDFKKYNLSPTKSICDKGKYPYKHEHEIVQYKIFEIRDIYFSEAGDRTKTTGKILDHMEEKVQCHKLFTS